MPLLGFSKFDLSAIEATSAPHHQSIDYSKMIDTIG